MRKVLLTTLLVLGLMVAGSMSTQGDNSIFSPLIGVEALIVAPPPFYHYEGIPFKIRGIYGCHDGSSVYFKAGFGGLLEDRATIGLSGYRARKIHLLEYAKNAASLPDNFIAGTIIVHYIDSTLTRHDLIIGQNISDTDYSNPDTIDCMNHSRISPAYVYVQPRCPLYPYPRAGFYTFIDVAYKNPDFLELIANPEVLEQQECNGTMKKWFEINVIAITLEQ